MKATLAGNFAPRWTNQKISPERLLEGIRLRSLKSRGLTQAPGMTILRGVNGLTHICGICPEIMR